MNYDITLHITDFGISAASYFYYYIKCFNMDGDRVEADFICFWIYKSLSNSVCSDGVTLKKIAWLEMSRFLYLVGVLRCMLSKCMMFKSICQSQV